MPRLTSRWPRARRRRRNRSLKPRSAAPAAPTAPVMRVAPPRWPPRTPLHSRIRRCPICGRDFTGHDDDKSLPVMIVNQEFVRRFLANRNPIGGKVNGWGKWFTVVRVAKDITYHTLTESPQPYFYIPLRQIYRPEMGVTFYVRTTGAPETTIAAMRRGAR